MRKLLLDVDDLRVASFETARTAADADGTVRANGEHSACGAPIGVVRTGTGCPATRNCVSGYTVCGCSVTSCDDELLLH